MEAQSRILLILRFLYEKTDAEHPVTSRQIKRMLEEQGQPAPDSRTIDSDIEMIQAAGIRVIRSHYNGGSARYCIEERAFDTIELKILMDAVSSSQFFSADRSRKIIQKLAHLTNEREREQLLSTMGSIPSIKKAAGGKIYAADALFRAIVARRKIQFQLVEFAVPDKKPVLHRGGKIYTVSPYALVWNQDRYYLVAHEKERNIILTPRADHIRRVKMLEESISPPPEGFDIGNYCSRRYKMYSGPEEEITLLCKNHLLGKVIDHFGSDFACTPVSDTVFKATVLASVGPTLFGWLFQYAGDMQLTGPESVVSQYKNHLRNAEPDLLSGCEI